MNDKIIIDPTKAKAHVYYDFESPKRHHRVYLVKVLFEDAGLFINSITVQPSIKDPSKLWVQQPRYNVRGTWVWPVQMISANLLWQTVERLALEAVNKYQPPINGTYEGVGDRPFVKPESQFL